MRKTKKQGVDITRANDARIEYQAREDFTVRPYRCADSTVSYSPQTELKRVMELFLNRFQLKVSGSSPQIGVSCDDGGFVEIEPKSRSTIDAVIDRGYHANRAQIQGYSLNFAEGRTSITLANPDGVSATYI